MKLETHLLAASEDEMRLLHTRLLEPTGFQFDDYARQLYGGESLALWVKNGHHNMLIRIDNAEDFTEAEASFVRISRPEKWGWTAVRVRR